MSHPPVIEPAATEPTIERRRRLTLAVASLATLATFLDTTILFVAFPDISSTFTTASPSTFRGY